MSRPRTRRCFAAILLVVLLASAIPAEAASFAGGLPPSDLWARAWSWLKELWDGALPESGAAPEGSVKNDPLLPPLPPPIPPACVECNGGAEGGGDSGSGSDPDG